MYFHEKIKRASRRFVFFCLFCAPGGAPQRIAGAPAKVQAGITDLIEKGIAVEWDIDVRVTNAFLGVRERPPRADRSAKGLMKRFLLLTRRRLFVLSCCGCSCGRRLQVVPSLRYIFWECPLKTTRRYHCGLKTTRRYRCYLKATKRYH